MDVSYISHTTVLPVAKDLDFLWIHEDNQPTFRVQPIWEAFSFAKYIKRRACVRNFYRTWINKDTSKYPLYGYILGVLTYTNAKDRGGDETVHLSVVLKLIIRSSDSPLPALG